MILTFQESSKYFKPYVRYFPRTVVHVQTLGMCRQRVWKYRHSLVPYCRYEYESALTCMWVRACLFVCVSVHTVVFIAIFQKRKLLNIVQRTQASDGMFQSLYLQIVNILCTSGNIFAFDKKLE